MYSMYSMNTAIKTSRAKVKTVGRSWKLNSRLQQLQLVNWVEPLA